MNIFKIQTTFLHLFVKWSNFERKRLHFASKVEDVNFKLFPNTLALKVFSFQSKTQQNREGLLEFHFSLKTKANAAYFASQQQKWEPKNEGLLVQSLILILEEVFLEKTLRSQIAQWICFTKIWKSPPSDKNSQRSCFPQFSCEKWSEFFGSPSSFIQKFRTNQTCSTLPKVSKTKLSLVLGS